MARPRDASDGSLHGVKLEPEVLLANIISSVDVDGLEAGDACRVVVGVVDIKRGLQVFESSTSLVAVCMVERRAQPVGDGLHEEAI